MHWNDLDFSLMYESVLYMYFSFSEPTVTLIKLLQALKQNTLNNK